jgi:hypothetical protein
MAKKSAFASPLLQMASQRAQAETTTAAELILPHAATEKLRHQPLTSARVCCLRATTGCSPFIPPLQHISCSGTGALLERLRMWGSIKIDWHPFLAICDELKLLKSSEDPEVRGFQSELVTRLSARSIGTGRPPTSGICSNLPQLS